MKYVFLHLFAKSICLKSRTFDGIGREESQILGFKRVLVGEFCVAALRFRLPRQRRVVYFEAARLNNTNISRNAVAKFDFDDITDADLFGFKCLLETLSHDNGVLRHHVLERFHNFVTLKNRLGLGCC